MTAAPARFTFDLDLGRRQERNRMVSEAALEELLKAARQEGFAQGYAEAEAGTAATAAQLITTAAETLADRAAAMTAALDEARRNAQAEAVELAVTIARKLAPELIAREPAAELEALIEESLSSLEGVPHLVIRCHPDLADRIRDVAQARVQISGFAGRLVVMGDPDEALSDGRIEWADGGLVRNVAAISADIDRAVLSYLTARGIKAPEETPK
jgi:flagellar assembly protein FliH